MNNQFHKGQKVDYYAIWASEGDRGRAKPLRQWLSGYVIVEPISPYNPACILIAHEDPKDWHGPFNAEPQHVRPAYV